MTNAEWVARYRAMREIAGRICTMRTERARKLAGEAGLDPQMPFLHAHNALVGLAHGAPWSNVDYAKARAVRRLDTERFAGYRILDRWHARKSLPPWVS